MFGYPIKHEDKNKKFNLYIYICVCVMLFQSAKISVIIYKYRCFFSVIICEQIIQFNDTQIKCHHIVVNYHDA